MPSGIASVLSRLPTRRWRAFLSHLQRRFVEDDCLLWAGPLSYTTIVAVVPLAAVTLSVFDQLSAGLLDFVFREFVPAVDGTLERYIDEFAAQASQLKQVGVLFLIVTALFLISQIEQALNRIWRVSRPRSPAAKLLVYWAALTLGPLLFGTGLAVSSYLVSLPFVEGAAQRIGAGRLLLEAVPFLLAAMGFMLLYLVLPNRTVRWRSALAGALVAAVLFELANRGFAFYVKAFPTYEVIYGALAAVPVFLAWIYLSWVVVLFGASFSAAISTFRPEGAARSRRGADFLTVFRIVGHLWTAQRAGRSVSLYDLLEREPEVSEMRLQRLLTGVEEARLIHRAGRDEWLLARDPAEVTLYELYRSGELALPSADDLPSDGDAWDEAFKAALAQLRGPLEERLGTSLKELYRVEPLECEPQE